MSSPGPSPELFSATLLPEYARYRGGLFARLLAKVAPRFLGDSLLVSTPSSFASWPPGAADLFGIARTLRNHQVLDSWHEMPSFPDEPPLFAYESIAKDAGLANGVDPFNKNAALVRMLAESYERSRLRAVDLTKQYPTAQGTPQQLEASGYTLTPSRFTGWTEKQLAHEPALAGRERASYTWVKLPTLDGRVAWIPLSAVSAHHEASLVAGGIRHEPLVRPLTSTGLATGRSIDEALVRGVLEVIERDAFMVAYLNRLPAEVLDAAELAQGDKELEILLGYMSRFDLTLRLLRIPSEFPVYSICAVIEDTTHEGPAIVVGGKASFSKTEAVFGAIGEALYDRRVYRAGRLGERPLPHDPRAFTTQDRIAYWGRREREGDLDFFYSKESCTSPTVSTPTSSAEGLRILKDALARGGFDACFADLTDDVGKALGWHTVLSVIPGLHPMHLDEHLPYVGGERLTHTPVRLGYTTRDEMNPIPHPYP